MTKALVTLVLASTMALGACSTGKKPKQETAAIAVTTPTTVTIPEETTTTTIPETTTTVGRVVTTTTVAPEPEPLNDVRNSATDPDGLPWPSPNDADWNIWLAMGRCEQPGPGLGGVWWSHRGPRYGGGLGFWLDNGRGGTWAAYGGRILGIANPGDATPEEQIWVARRVRAAHGYSAWGCAGKVGVG